MTDSESKIEYKTDPKTGQVSYQDPETKIEYIWDQAKNTWKCKNDDGKSQETDYEFDGQTYFHTDAKGIKHKWDLDKKEWIKVESESESEEEENTTDEERKAKMFRKRKAAPGWNAQTNYTTDPESGAQVYKDPIDGMTYEWDVDKKAWFPKINEDFLAQYQMNYGFTKDGKAEPTKPDEVPEVDKPKEGEEPGKKAKKEVSKPQWYEADEEKSTKVYVTGKIFSGFFC